MTALLFALLVVGVVTAVLDAQRATRSDVAPLVARLEREVAGLHDRWARPAAAEIRRRVALRPLVAPVTWHVAPWPAPDGRIAA